MSKFQLVVLGIFAFAIVAGLTAFATLQGKGKVVPNVTIWGTIDASTFNAFTKKVTTGNGNTMNIIYVQKRESNFDSDLLEALATNKGPDIIMVTQATLLKQLNKLTVIPFSAYPQANFTSNFIQETELFLSKNGVMAIPFSVDPMVMYWNRDIFTNANISLPPKYWDEFKNLVPQLTKKDSTGSIIQSGVALGEYQNIDHAKDILNLLMLQAGNPLAVTAINGYQSTLSQAFSYAISPANAALTFYTQFADPLKDVYSWNRALSSSKLMFYSNKLGIYFGYASENKEIQQKNPNLNYEVAFMPQSRPQAGAQNLSKTFGTLYGFSLLKSSRQQQNALNAMSLLTTKSSLALWSQYSESPSVRRDGLTPNPNDPASPIVTTSALWARAWLEPDRAAVDSIYKSLIEDITSGSSLFSDAITAADTKIQNLYNVINNR